MRLLISFLFLLTVWIFTADGTKIAMLLLLLLMMMMMMTVVSA